MDTHKISLVGWIILSVAVILLLITPESAWAINYLSGIAGGLFLSNILRGI